MLITNLLAEGNGKIKHETGNDGSEKRTGKLRWASMFGFGGTLRPLAGHGTNRRIAYFFGGKLCISQASNG
jgi:hypothetical protein